MHGVITAIATPFLTNSIDFASLDNLLKKQIEAKVSGIVIFGSTGECMNIELDEYEKALKHVANYLENTNIKLLAGVSSTGTSKLIKLAEIAKKNGAFGVLASPSPYNKPTQDGIFEIYKSLSQVEIPFVAYNIPGRTSVDITDATIIKIAELPNFIGLKDSTGDLKRVIQNKSFNLLCGDDYMFLSSMLHGAGGVISVASNIIPKTFVKMYNLCQQNNYVEAAKIFNSVYHIFCSLYCQSNPIPVKFCLKKIGIFKSDELRSPLISLQDMALIDILAKDLELAQVIENTIC